MTDETSPPKVYLTRPRDESLDAYKEWIKELTTRLTGKTEDDGSMTEADWAEEWKLFWE